MIHLLLLMLACGSETEDLRGKLSPKAIPSSEISTSPSVAESQSALPPTEGTPKGLEEEPEFAVRLSSLETAPPLEARKTVSLAQLLANRHSQLVSTYGPPRVVGMGILTDADWCRQLFPYSDRLSKLLGLDFAQLAGVESRLGVVGVSRVVDHVPTTDERYAELKHLLRLIELTDTVIATCSSMLLRIRSPNRQTRAALLYMDMMLKYGAAQRANAKEALDPLETPYAALVSNVTGLPYETPYLWKAKRAPAYCSCWLGPCHLGNLDQTLSISSWIEKKRFH